MDFENRQFIAKLAHKPADPEGGDPYGELRRTIYHCFRPLVPSVAEPVAWPHIWPWIYGDAFGSFPENGPGNMLTMTALQDHILSRWVAGDFMADWDQDRPHPATIDQVPLAAQPGMLDQAALHYCLADTFHPGCEMTWPMRHATLYAKPFRIRQRQANEPELDCGPKLNPINVELVDGPLYAQGPGDITRWMALPWQGDTAFCRSGYDPEFDPFLPTFWAARVPNQVLTEADYRTVMDETLPRATRIAAYHHRASWLRTIDEGTVSDVMMRMIKDFGKLGIVEVRPGLTDDPDFPEYFYVETLAAETIKQAAAKAGAALHAVKRPLTALEKAGWASREQFETFRSVRVRHPS